MASIAMSVEGPQPQPDRSRRGIPWQPWQVPVRIAFRNPESAAGGGWRASYILLQVVDMVSIGGYPLVNVYIAMENHHF